MLAYMTDPEICSYEIVGAAVDSESGCTWTVQSLLTSIACAQAPHYHALIDTGALVTGMWVTGRTPRSAFVIDGIHTLLINPRVRALLAFVGSMGDEVLCKFHDLIQAELGSIMSRQISEEQIPIQILQILAQSWPISTTIIEATPFSNCDAGDLESDRRKNT